MDNLEGLVSRLPVLKELYQLEEFRVLEGFLRSLRDDLYTQLLGINVSVELVPKIAALQAQLNLVASLYELPKLVEATKVRLETLKAHQIKLMQSQED